MKTTGPCATPDTITHPPHPDSDDGRWPFLMIHGSTAVWADTRTELIGELIAGYDDLADDPDGYQEATGLRYVQAVTVTTAVQTSVLLEAGESGAFDPAVLVTTPKGDEQLQALMIERTVPFAPAPGTPLDGDGDDGPVWDHEVPLVLIATDYAPFTDRARPTGRIIWFDPSNERTHLNSLADLGQIALFIDDPDAGADEAAEA
jgi:hypothetical protein